MQFVFRDYVYEQKRNLMQPNTTKSYFRNMAMNLQFIVYLININDTVLTQSVCCLL